jgi:hypothetical protein
VCAPSLSKFTRGSLPASLTLLFRQADICESFLKTLGAHRLCENVPKRISHTANIVSISVSGQGKTTPPKYLAKMALYVLCHPLLDLDLLRSTENGRQVVPATRNRRLGLMQLLEPPLGELDRECEHFAVINPGAHRSCRVDLILALSCDVCT